MFFINPFIFAAGGDFESIATVTVGSGGASSIEFTSIPGTYQHLQVRLVARNAAAVNDNSVLISLNGNTTGGSYTSHYLRGSGSSATAGADTSTRILGRDLIPGANRSASIFGTGIYEILDYANTSKNTTTRLFGGHDTNGAGFALLSSGVFMVTDAITSIALTISDATNFVQHSTAALYGIKAP